LGIGKVGARKKLGLNRLQIFGFKPGDGGADASLGGKRIGSKEAGIAVKYLSVQESLTSGNNQFFEDGRERRKSGGVASETGLAEGSGQQGLA